MVPAKRWSGLKPKVDYCRVFGSIAYVHVLEQKRTKLNDRSHKCVLLGVSEESKVWLLYDPVHKKVIANKDVVFEVDEN